ncbi:MAG: hypothetical protein QM496_00200 [Verrucomicrobiota bacterium]
MDLPLAILNADTAEIGSILSTNASWREIKSVSGLSPIELVQASGKLPVLLTFLQHDASIIEELDSTFKNLLLALIEETSWDHTAAYRPTDIEFYLWAAMIGEVSIDFPCDLIRHISQVEIDNLKFLFNLSQTWSSEEDDNFWLTENQ